MARIVSYITSNALKFSTTREGFFFFPLNAVPVTHNWGINGLWGPQKMISMSTECTRIVQVFNNAPDEGKPFEAGRWQP